LIAIQPISGIGEIRRDDDLGALLTDALQPLAPQAGDIVVVTQKIVSKAEGRMVALNTVTPSARALELAAVVGKDARLVELALRESIDVVRAVRGVLITRHRLGYVMANAGIDASNIGAGNNDAVLLLPLNPDETAARLRQSLQQKLGVALGIVISDSFGRPWRNGVVNVALGSAGILALCDKRGMTDRDGRELQVTQIAYGDLLASAAGLVMGEAAESIPAVLIRGCALPAGDVPAAALVRNLDEDLFR
jgi:coenzyme F420-0:L-glutamate ligase/coenzyme F420-1:gamma-L-glutamate ligase